MDFSWIKRLGAADFRVAVERCAAEAEGARASGADNADWEKVASLIADAAVALPGGRGFDQYQENTEESLYRQAADALRLTRATSSAGGLERTLREAAHAASPAVAGPRWEYVRRRLDEAARAVGRRSGN